MTLMNTLLFGVGCQNNNNNSSTRSGSFARESADFGSSVNCEQRVPFILSDDDEEEIDNGSSEQQEKETPAAGAAAAKKEMKKKKRFACVFDCSSIKGERQYMEDRWNVVRSKCNRVAVFGVYDGHGGCQVSELLAKTLGEKICRDIGRLKRAPRETIEEAFREVDAVAVKENPGRCRRSQVSGKMLGSPGAGSTAIVAVVCSWGKVYFANVGDSKATVVRGEEECEENKPEIENDENENDSNLRAADGKNDNKNNNNRTPTRASSRRQSLSQSNRSTPAKKSSTPRKGQQQLKTMNSDINAQNNNSKIVFETPDQRPTRDDERTRINNIGGKILKSRDGSARVEGILAVTRAFGNAGIKQFVEAVPEIFEFPIERCGTVVLCTDGVTDVINTENLSTLVAKAIEDDKRARIERQKQRMSLNNNNNNIKEGATKSGRSSRLGSPHKDSSLRNERTSSETLTSVSTKRRSRDNITAVVFRCSENLSSFDYFTETKMTMTASAAHIHAAILNHARTVPTSPVMSPMRTDLSKGAVESEELAVHLRESVQAVSAVANTPTPNKKKKTSSSSSPKSPLPLPVASNKKQKTAMEPKATKSPLGVVKKEKMRSPLLNA